MDQTSNNTIEAASPTFNTQAFNQNVTVIANAVEFATAVIVSMDSELVASSLRGGDMNVDAVRAAVTERLQSNLKIKD